MRDSGTIVPAIESHNIGGDHGPAERYSRAMTRRANANACTAGDGYLGEGEQEELRSKRRRTVDSEQGEV